jgi:hypothetical protein
VKKSKVSKLPERVPKAAVGAKPIFGSAKGLITFKKGWGAPMTKREFEAFIRG